VKKLAPSFLVVVTALVLGATAFAASNGTAWSAKLTAAQEIPKQVVKAPSAKGAFSATLTGTTLKWKLTFSGLSGPASAAHIHLGAMGKAGGVVVALCGPCKTGVRGSAKLTKALIAAARKHKLYVNVHTAKNPNGEIRGQIAP
jgi:hypothetical protein